MQGKEKKQINMNEGQEYVLGMDIGGTNCRMGLVNRNLNVIGMEVCLSKEIWASDNAMDALAGVIGTYIEKQTASLTDIQADKIEALSMGFPSLVDKTRTRLLSSTNFPGLDGVNIVEELERRLHKKVYIEHDAYYLLAHDIRVNGLKNKGTMVGLYFGTGLGNAMFINGQPYIGKNGAACELGHIPVPFNDYLCSCGNRGCIEMFSCGKAMERINGEHYSGTPIGELFLKHGNDKIMKDFVGYMAAAVSTEINILDPDYVFIGGGIVHMQGFPKDLMEEKILQHVRKPYPAQGLKLLFQKPGAENGIIGAAIRVFDRTE